MGDRHQSRAFILSAADYRESSRLLHVLCEKEGRISLVARGLRSSKKTPSAASEPFSLVVINYTIKPTASMGSVSSIELERSFGGIRTDLAAYAFATYWFDVLKTTSQERSAPESVFNFTEKMLLGLEHNQGRHELPRDVLPLLVSLIQALGFGLDTNSCGSCGRSGIALPHLDTRRATPICADCSSPTGSYLPFEGTAVEYALRPGASENTSTLPPQLFMPLLEMLNRLLETSLEHRFKTFPFLREVIAGKAG